MKYLISFIALIAIVTSVGGLPCNEGEHPTTTPSSTSSARATPTASLAPTSSASPPTAELKSCDGIKYDPSKKTCCQYTLFDGTDVSCCGYNRYYPEKGEGCCGLEKVYNPKNRTCCNDLGTPKDPIRQQYGDTSFALFQGANLTCCGRYTFDPKKESCCLGVPKDGVGWNCCEISSSACCGQREYNSNTQLCCMGAVYPRRENQICCGGSIYDTTKETCCNEPPTVLPGLNTSCS